MGTQRAMTPPSSPTRHVSHLQELRHLRTRHLSFFLARSRKEGPLLFVYCGSCEGARAQAPPEIALPSSPGLLKRGAAGLVQLHTLDGRVRVARQARKAWFDGGLHAAPSNVCRHVIDLSFICALGVLAEGAWR